ncbi:MAG TPA: D-hexose-6-phosphate mutarotase [Polyangia bacterium]|nr:D-hexose-6-phosphate mutarotase [Polyangia bacterium]
MLPRWNLGVHNGLDVVEVETAAATALVAVQGAQVLSFVPRGGRDWLWVSERARWARGAAVRGGIPVCFPWFGPHPTQPGFPAHGFARTTAWRFSAGRETDGAGAAIELTLTGDEATSKLFPHRFEARLTITVGAELSLAFEVANTGTDPFSFEAALHTYFGVSDVADVSVEGLAGCDFVDKVAGGAVRKEGAAPLRIAGEVDRVYDSPGPVTLRDPGGGRALRIETAGAPSTVVWNPAPAKTATLGDLTADAWRRFVCVESGAIGAGRVRLAPAARHGLVVRYTALDDRP